MRIHPHVRIAACAFAVTNTATPAAAEMPTISSCDGLTVIAHDNHDFGCWSAAMRDVLARLGKGY